MPFDIKKCVPACFRLQPPTAVTIFGESVAMHAEFPALDSERMRGAARRLRQMHGNVLASARNMKGCVREASQRSRRTVRRAALHTLARLMCY